MAAVMQGEQLKEAELKRDLTKFVLLRGKSLKQRLSVHALKTKKYKSSLMQGPADFENGLDLDSLTGVTRL